MDPVVVSAVAQPGQISLWHLIMQASWPVFLVMVGLALASVWCWAVIIEKYFALVLYDESQGLQMALYVTCLYLEHP